MPAPASPHLAPRRFRLVPIAWTGDRFTDFAPYVASIADSGTVAFQATTRMCDGRSSTGIFTGDGATITVVAEPTASPAAAFVSHPAIDGHGNLSVYVRLASGADAVLVAGPGGTRVLADSRSVFRSIGSAGPTMNRAGAVGFRAHDGAGEERPVAFMAFEGRLTPVNEAGRFRAIEGLPMVNDQGHMAIRATSGAAEGIYLWRDGALETVVETGSPSSPEWANRASTVASRLGRFPFLLSDDSVVFEGTVGDRDGIYVASGAGISCVIQGRPAGQAGFESFRGAYVDHSGAVVFYATPANGTIGLYSGADPVADRIVGVGDRLWGVTGGDARITEVVMNPVSINARGQLAVRLRLADGRGAIVRLDPEA